MVKADRLNYIMLDLSTREWKPVTKLLTDTTSTYYLPPKDILNPDAYKPPNFPDHDLPFIDFSYGYIDGYDDVSNDSYAVRIYTSLILAVNIIRLMVVHFYVLQCTPHLIHLRWLKWVLPHILKDYRTHITILMTHGQSPNKLERLFFSNSDDGYSTSGHIYVIPNETQTCSLLNKYTSIQQQNG